MLSVCEVAVSLITFTTLLSFVSPVNVTGSDLPMVFLIHFQVIIENID